MDLDDCDTVNELPAPPRKDIPAADRELLELAARALGAVRFEEVDGEGYGNLHFEDGSVVHAWNPLQFWGDTFEMAVRLQLDVLPAGPTREDQPTAMVRDGGDLLVLEEHNGDALVTTARAVTRAAAEIGKTK